MSHCPKKVPMYRVSHNLYMDGTMGHFYSLISNFIKILRKTKNVKIKIYKIKEMFEISRRKCPIVPKGPNV